MSFPGIFNESLPDTEKRTKRELEVDENSNPKIAKESAKKQKGSYGVSQRFRRKILQMRHKNLF